MQSAFLEELTILKDGISWKNARIKLKQDPICCTLDSGDKSFFPPEKKKSLLMQPRRRDNPTRNAKGPSASSTPELPDRKWSDLRTRHGQRPLTVSTVSF